MPENTSPPAGKPAATPAGERIAKVLSRRGIASRREAERLIEAGEVTVNGKVIDSPALNVTDSDRITVSGRALPAAEPARLWLYYKPEGLVTSAADEKGRDTVFDHLPEDMPRVMSVGRLDLNSEGLLLLTNDGELKRRLELPSTGWLRKYRVRVNGAADDLKLQILRDGITIEGERFKPMQVTIDRQQGANAWLTVGLREGRNREIRRAMNAIGLYVNRLIRVSYGPFRLGDLEPGAVEEVKARVLRDQLGEIAAEDAAAETGAAKPATRGKPGAEAGPRRIRAPRASAAKTGSSERAPAKSAPPSGTSNRAPARRQAAGADDIPAGLRLSRPVRPGDGVAALSGAWREATTPRPGPKVRVEKAGTGKPATRSSRTAGEAPGTGRTTGPKSGAKDSPFGRSRDGGARPSSTRGSDSGAERFGKERITRDGAPAPKGSKASKPASDATAERARSTTARPAAKGKSPGGPKRPPRSRG